MSLKTVTAFSFSCSAGSFSSSSIPVYAFSSKFLYLSSQKSTSCKLIASVSKETNVAPLEGAIYQPLEQLKKEAFAVPVYPEVSLARQNYTEVCEAAINEQINVEYHALYVYDAMFAYFDKDNIALKGLAKFFKKSGDKEREHAEKLIKYQNIRGGIVTLYSVVRPQSNFTDALSAMELALSLEKLQNEKLLNLHRVAASNGDPQMAEFIESEFLTEQVEVIKKIAEFVSHLRMVGGGRGVWYFDQQLLHENDA